MTRFRSRVWFHFVWMILVIGAWAVVIGELRVERPTLFYSGMTALLVLALSGMARGMARRLARPIEALTEATRRFGAGELSYRLPLPSGLRSHHRHGPGRTIDEMLQLGRTWNQMADRIEQLVRGQKELLANVSHDLRSPLARIRVALELLPRNEAGAERLRAIDEDLVELERLIDDVLTAARLDGAPAPARRTRVAIARLLIELAVRAENDPRLTGRIEVSTIDATVEADEGLLRRALTNLIENAAKHGAPPIILAASRTDDGAVLVTVTDAGPGIAPDERDRIFEPFYRVDRARTPGAGGVGLGLTIARRVAEVHGGSIAVEPARSDGTGCRFVLRLPA